MEKPTIDYVLERGVSDVLPTKDGLKKLMEDKKIKLYQGFDPTASSLHVGNFIGLRKLSQFQKLGHEVIFLVGDGTGQAGDPSGKDKTRETFFTKDELIENAKGWVEQTKNILDYEGDNPVKVMYNSEWLNELGLVDILNIANNFTVQQMIERDMFERRIEAQEPINLREFLYPLLQGYDSVAMDVDLEIGGNDQLFNMLAGRTLMKNMKDKEKYVLTMKILADSEGRKMGKSEGNAINLTDSGEDLYGKIMSWPDDMIASGIELLTDLPMDTANQQPLLAKKELAFDVVRQIKGEKGAGAAEENFQKTFQDADPDYDRELDIKGMLQKVVAHEVESMSEAKRLITQGGVYVNDNRMTNPLFEVSSGDKIKIGKKIFVKIK